MKEALDNQDSEIDDNTTVSEKSWKFDGKAEELKEIDEIKNKIRQEWNKCTQTRQYSAFLSFLENKRYTNREGIDVFKKELKKNGSLTLNIIRKRFFELSATFRFNAKIQSRQKSLLPVKFKLSRWSHP